MKYRFSPLSRRAFLAAAGAVAVQIKARGQAQSAGSPDATFSTDVRVVNVLAAVHDKSGKIVNDLTKDDFDLSEDGHPQTIKYFSRETDMPLTLGLLVDTSGSQRRVLGDERDASYRFLERVLREDKDQAFLIHFDFDTELLQDLTNSRQKLEHALDQLNMSSGQPQMRNSGGGYPGGGYPGGGGGGYGRRGGGTTLYDAVLLASNEIMRNQQGRKAVILLTDGVDNGSKVSLPAAIEAAQRADTLVYSIMFEGDEPNQNPLGGFGRGMGRRGGMSRMPVQTRPNGKKILQQMSRETGGGFFEVSRKDSIDQIYDRIQEELRNQYSIGYTSNQGDSGGFRKITLTVKQKNMTVQAREGYYPTH